MFPSIFPFYILCTELAHSAILELWLLKFVACLLTAKSEKRVVFSEKINEKIWKNSSLKNMFERALKKFRSY
jgi:ribosomal protein L31E